MKKLIAFFKTSPLKRGELIIRVIGIILLSVMFISGSIYLFNKDPRDIGSFSFAAVSVLILGIGIWGINPEACKNWWRHSLPPNNKTF